MVALVVRTHRHKADESKRSDSKGVTDCRKSDAVLHFPHRELPAFCAIHGGGMCKSHTFDRSGHIFFEGSDEKSCSTIDVFGSNVRTQGHVVHIDKMLPKRRDIHAVPIRRWIRHKKQHNLLNGRKCRLPTLSRSGSRR